MGYFPSTHVQVNTSSKIGVSCLGIVNVARKKREREDQWKAFLVVQLEQRSLSCWFPSLSLNVVESRNTQERNLARWEFERMRRKRFIDLFSRFSISVICECCMTAWMYLSVSCPGMSTFRKTTHLSPVNTTHHGRLLTSSTSTNCNVVLRHHRPSCVLSYLFSSSRADQN